jgi:hypothetical protein
VSKLYVISFLVVTLLFGCSTTTLGYKDTQPEFDLKEYFTGELKGWGLIKNYQGKVTKRFTVDMTGTWENNKGVLYELFTYQDGTTQERTWYLTKQENNINTGTASDVVGEASGTQQGFAFNWNYDLLFESDGSQIQVHLQDWLYQVDDKAVISEAKIKKFGVNVGEVIVFILKQDTEQ